MTIYGNHFDLLPSTILGVEHIPGEGTLVMLNADLIDGIRELWNFLWDCSNKRKIKYLYIFVIENGMTAHGTATLSVRYSDDSFETIFIGNHHLQESEHVMLAAFI